MAEFELNKTDLGQFYFRIVRDDEALLWVSELYDSKASAQHGIEAVREVAADLVHYQPLQDERGKYGFILKAAHGQCLGQSVWFADAVAAQAAQEVLMHEAALAGVLEDW